MSIGFRIYISLSLSRVYLCRLYDVQTFFASFNYFNISALASQANINQSLLRQYAKGIKFLSIEQAKKIEKTIHQLASKMQRISLTA
jgi:hypothetical protein